MIILALLVVLAASRVEGECVDVYPYALDIGFYFASVARITNDVPQIVWTKSCIGEHAASFDPTKPTQLGIHGLQPDSVVQNVRFMINDTADNPVFAGVVAGWLALGYNFGVFEWTQLADEPLSNFMRAEGKINATDFLANTEYVYVDRNTGLLAAPADAQKKSIIELLFDHYADHFTGDVLPPRIFGHSLGAQVVVYFTELLITMLNALNVVLPERIALLDPVFSSSSKPYLVGNACGLEISDVLGCYMQQITARGVAAELYRASFINRCIFSSDNNAPLVANSAAASLKFNEWGTQKQGYCWNADLMSHMTTKNIDRIADQIYEQHKAVVSWYLSSFLAANPPRICIRKNDPSQPRCDPTRSLALSAAMPTADVLEWSRRTVPASGGGVAKACFYQFDDYASTRTVTPTDDMFYVDDCFHFNL
jgi:hypothetical protein